MRKTAKAIPFVLALMSAAAFAHYPGVIKLDTKGGTKQPAVTFDHAKHGDKLVKTCGHCHHTQKDLKKAHTDTTDVKKCVTCHVNPKPKVPNILDASLKTNPYHVNCVGCHKEQKKGPTVCKDCHKK